MTDESTIPNIDRGSLIGIVILWVMALFWNGFVATALMLARREGLPAPASYGLASPFILAGVFLLGTALNSTFRIIRYRSLILHLDTLPGVVGGRIAGTLHGAPGVLNEGMSFRLACWRRPKVSDSFDEMVWEDMLDIPPGSMMQSPAGATVPFRFDVPYECEPTTGAGDDSIYWRVTVQTHHGGKMAGSFEVPVRRTAQSSPEINEKSLRPRTIAQPPYSKLRLQRAAGGAVEIRFPRPTWLWKWWLFTLVVAAAGFVFVPREFYVVVAATVLFLVAIIQMGVFFSPRLLRVGHDQLRMRFLSPFRGAKAMPASEIADFVYAFSNSNRNYDVEVQRADGKTYPWLMITAADKREAEWLAHELRSALARR